MTSLKKVVAAASAVAIATSALSTFASAQVYISDATSEAPFAAYLNMQIAGVSYSDPDDPDGDSGTTPIQFSEDGTYTVSQTLRSGSDSISLLILSTNINGYAFTKDGGDILTDTTISIVVDSVQIVHADGTTDTLAYDSANRDDGAFATENDGVSYRVNLLNQWTSNVVNDISGDLSATPMAEGDSIAVTFTISGLDNTGIWLDVGDVNADSNIDINDAFKVLQEATNVSAGLDPSFDEGATTRADVNGDSKVDISDAFAILSYVTNVSAGLNPAVEDYFTVLKNA